MKFCKACVTFIISLLLAACTNNSLTIKGNLKGASGARKVYLYSYNTTQPAALDSTNLSADGSFRFKKQLTTPALLSVEYMDKHYILVGNPGDNLSLQANITNLNSEYKITGSADAELVNTFNNSRRPILDKIAALVSKVNNGHTTPTEQEVARVQSLTDSLDVVNLTFLQQHPRSLTSVYAAATLTNPKAYIPQLKQLAGRVPAQFKEIPTVKAFFEEVTGSSNVAIGKIAPAFSLNTATGQKFGPANYRGKVLLIDFWASWCQPCRMENPNVVAAYQQFHSKGFEVLGVSLDTDLHAWQEAIKADHLSWQQVSELQDFNSPTAKLYRVTSIPSNFLLNKEGKIVAVNLRGEELLQALKQMLP